MAHPGGRPREIDHDDVVRLRNAGFSIEEIAEEMACNDNHVREILRARGMGGLVRVVKVDRQRLLDLWNSPRTLIEIGAELGCSCTTVSRLQREHGLPRRTYFRPDMVDDVTPEEDAASADSLALSPWVQSRIKELRLGMPA